MLSVTPEVQRKGPMESDKRTLRRSDKGQRLVEAAVELLLERGLESWALKDAADKAEVPLGNVYYYFKTKKALIDKALSELEKDVGFQIAKEEVENLSYTADIAHVRVIVQLMLEDIVK